MKKMMFLCMLLLASLWAYGQGDSPDYYNGHKTVHGKQVAYVCDSRGGGDYIFFRLFNTTNTGKLNGFYKLKDGKTAPPDAFIDWKLNDPGRTITYRILKECLTPEEIKVLKNSSLSLLIACAVELDGSISEVDFFFDNDPRLCAISPDTFYALEQKIKKHLTYDVDPIDKEVYLYGIMDMVMFFKNMP